MLKKCGKLNEGVLYYKKTPEKGVFLMKI